MLAGIKIFLVYLDVYLVAHVHVNTRVCVCVCECFGVAQMVLPEIPHFLAGQAFAEEGESHTCIQLLPQKCQILSYLQFMEQLQLLQLLPPIRTARVVLQHIPAPAGFHQGGVGVFLNLGHKQHVRQQKMSFQMVENSILVTEKANKPPARR